MKYFCLLVVVLFTSISCQPKADKLTLTGIIGSWYGFYPLYYANELGIAEKHGVDLRLIETGSALDLRRGYLKPTVHFMATSLVEVSNAFLLNQGQVTLFAITDYSNGSDVIVTRKDIANVEQLATKRIGVDSFSVGMYVLKRALLKYGISDPINHVVVGSDAYGEAFQNDLIDAAVTYPPFSSQLIKDDDLHVIYSTDEDPGKVFDTLVIKDNMAEKAEKKLWNIWFETVEKIEADPRSFADFIAEITDNSTENILSELKGMKILNEQEYLELMQDESGIRKELALACTVARDDKQACDYYAENIKFRVLDAN